MDLSHEWFAAVGRGDVAGAARVLAAEPAVLASRIHGATGLHRAAARGDLALLALLVDHGAALEATDDAGVTALGWATEEARDAAVDFLLARGARATAADLAARGLAQELARALDTRPWELEQRTVLGTPLHAAARRGRLEAARLLLERGADPGARDDEGRTAAELASEAGQPALRELFERELARRGDASADRAPGARAAETASYRCGACGEEIVIDVDRTEGEEQRFVEDCPVCCRANVIELRFQRGAVEASAELE